MLSVGLYASPFGPASPLTIPIDTTPAAAPIQVAAASGAARLLDAIHPAETSLRSFGVGTQVAASA